MPQKPGNKARLVSIIEQPGNIRCLEFWYHMYGPTIGQLNVYVNTNTSENETRTHLWTRGANVGDVWRKAHIPMEYTVPFRVIFEGVIGNGIEVSGKKKLFLFWNEIFLFVRVILQLMILIV
jgi:hypothetical protein